MTDTKLSQNFDANYYDEKYFADKQGKSFCKSDGSTDHWGYKNPEGEWLGCKPIVGAWKFMFQPKNMLDVGCGRGTFVTYARDIGVMAEGFDFSEWALHHLYPRCNKDWIKMHNVTKPWPYPDGHFDLVTVLDLMEHVYIDDIDSVINEMYRVAKKWIFLQIATVGGGSGNGIHESGYILEKDKPIPIELQSCAVAGHVSVSTEGFWLQKLKRDGWIVRRNLVERFCTIVPNDVIRNWTLNTILIFEKI
jgi:SAM-dependent methyltransferase